MNPGDCFKNKLSLGLRPKTNPSAFYWKQYTCQMRSAMRLEQTTELDVQNNDHNFYGSKKKKKKV